MISKLVIGIDPAYHATGFGIAIDSKLVSCFTYHYPTGVETMSQKRISTKDVLCKLIEKAQGRGYDVQVIFERTRTRNEGAQTLYYALTTQMLIGVIIDTAAAYDVHCHSVMTSAWKSKTCGTTTKSEMAQYTINQRDQPKKAKAVDYIEALGYDCTLRDAKGKVTAFKSGPRKGVRKEDDDKADAGCIALYGFVPEEKQKLENETLK